MIIYNKQGIYISDRQWFYQVCSEIGNFITSNNHNHLFGDTMPLDFFTDMCKDVFGT